MQDGSRTYNKMSGIGSSRRYNARRAKQVLAIRIALNGSDWNRRLDELPVFDTCR
jgi:hypothetical protein